MMIHEVSTKYTKIVNKKYLIYWKKKNCQKHHSVSTYLCYVESNINANDNKRKEKWAIIWFNSPFGKREKTTLGKTFLQLLSKHFAKSYNMDWILNRNTVKINNCKKKYCFHNFSTQSDNPIVQFCGCNCRVKSRQPLMVNVLRQKFFTEPIFLTNQTLTKVFILV